MPINIICASDNPFAPYCGVMLTSLFENNRNNNLAVYVLCDKSFSSGNCKKYQRLGKRYGQTVHIVPVDNSLTHNFPISQTLNHITTPTYYRLLACRLLPPDVDKAIYLDSDAIVTSSLEPMWSINMDGKAIAAVPDGWITYENNTYDHLDYDHRHGYFNAGILLINLHHWRQHNLEARMIDYIHQHRDNLPYNDQDVLNGVMHDNKLWLPERYNLQTKNLLKYYWECLPETYHQTLLRELPQAVIIHYCGKTKPWHYRYSGGAFHTLWENYRRLSPYPHCRIRRPLFKYLKRTVKDRLFPLRRQKRIAAIWQMTP